ncbi:MAG: DUF3943 domain-containing protein [Syntrophomonadaceae bacterium]
MFSSGLPTRPERCTEACRRRHTSNGICGPRGIFCAFTAAFGLAIASGARAQVVPHFESGRPESFSLGLDGAFQSAAAYQLEAAAATSTPISWTVVPAEPSSWGLGDDLFPNSFATPDGAGAPPPVAHRRFWLAAGELALMEFLPWAWNRYVTDEDFARISWHTVSENFKAGFGFDNDDFPVNQAQHPYHGSLFFNAARSNGYTYWESGLFTLAGSFVWECCMENTRPSWNDLVNTTLGGMALGEMEHRLSMVLLDNTATGGDRFWRELGAAIINPVGALTRLIDGDMFRQYPNPEERYPDGFRLGAQLGYRHIEGGQASNPDQASIQLSAAYGDPFYADVEKPFDAFWGEVDFNFPGGTSLSLAEVRGILRSWELTERTSSARQVLEVSQEYQYINNEAEVFGAEMFSGGWMSRYALPGSLVAATDLNALAIPLAGVKTINFAAPQTGRNYDYGPGGGARIGARLYAKDDQILDVSYSAVWTHTVNGVSDNNTLQFFRATAEIPIVGPLGVGGEYDWYSRKTSYHGAFFEPRQTQTQWSVFLTLNFGAHGLRKPKD